MPPKSPLDDPEQAAFAWARYKRIMRFMLLVTIIVVAAAMAAIFWSEAEVSPHFFIAVALGIGLTMLLASALMGLVFLSNGTGHDESIHNPLADEDGWHDSGEDDWRR
ncbi:MAG: hypothetical protein VX072_00755 [Pseudomonadota bacterium]|uniref:Uncharacterized protein n=1 Tax=Alteriqipengyuania abyssalis TaxID=2860200 RepID=A0ABS7PCD5_9SPHN|nr:MULTISPECIES: hypothetical protein [Sphingomonadales]MEC8178166.1 hypothetical protein [Pseudomonadota bacterium]ALG62174.1 hypothetical protein WG74_02610 [Citromicrobium sp. JL477]KPM14063.1 hypothetical protein VM77_13450 [Citromicrobium sp. JL31]KPM17409.1 hypothetical protein VO58_03905 [Citromicrobium sp. JL1351]KPM21410.1 hypothetical protein AAJ72_15425 [Citromicrobium sp. RCC1885]